MDEIKKKFSGQLLRWYDRYGRKNLPWQKNINPYRVWVSEIMLQQTQVTTVIPYFEKFMQTFPDVESLANTDIDLVLHIWTGLGYYSRARNLHKCAQIVQQQFDGIFPDNIEEMITLPGIGPSTAGAILAISMNKNTAILDGNVKRVLSRVYAIEDWISDTKVINRLWNIAKAHTPNKRVADYTQAIMDLGATLCTRTKPKCDECPMQNFCDGFSNGSPTNYPRKKPKKTKPIKSTVFMIIKNSDHMLLLERRPPAGIWGGLFCFVQCNDADEIESYCKATLGLRVKSIEKLPAFRHTFSHYHLNIQPVKVAVGRIQSKVMDCDDHFWYKLGQVNECGLAAPVKKLIDQLENEVTVL